MEEPLRSKDNSIRNAAIKWIVYDWGNIPPRENEDEDRLYELCSEFKNYSEDEVYEFVRRHRIDRIASWSKVLAFADSEKYAIYDARVAMSLNYILDEIDFSRKFLMPSALSKPLNKVFRTISNKSRTHFNGKKLSYMGYIEYSLLLKNFVRMNLAKNVLDAEMRLFANGEINANKYAAKYGLETPFKDKKQLNFQLSV